MITTQEQELRSKNILGKNSNSMTYWLVTLDKFGFLGGFFDKFVFISKMGIVIIIPPHKVRFLFNDILLKNYVLLS